MPKISEHRRAKIAELAEKTKTLHREGLTVREIALVVNKSKSWVQQKLSTVNTGQN